MKAAYPFRRTCKEATALMVAREDRQLPWIDRIGLRLHLLMCKACPKFERQMLTMRNAMKQWRGYTEDE
ncbi:zf-HC2 domain-containing protein [Hydrogenophaga pseudoflava]|uniref:zf-HC2 domain-containing protein n=1 Tax=Hydrogenophaga pseudoflava TaxID=47421 RepID=UPI0027E41BCB|nr:zf-HC2 domain-containing protein [Hydrogenophaga pseudoflava]MDQ7746737.1 zf-HC2 domain-containing protein [Hydrogenophaga pseudoflava]